MKLWLELAVLVLQKLWRTDQSRWWFRDCQRGLKYFTRFECTSQKKRFLSWPSSSSGSTKTPRFLAILRKSWRRLIIQKDKSCCIKVHQHRKHQSSKHILTFIPVSTSWDGCQHRRISYPARATKKWTDLSHVVKSIKTCLSPKFKYFDCLESKISKNCIWIRVKWSYLKGLKFEIPARTFNKHFNKWLNKSSELKTPFWNRHPSRIH